MQRYILIISFFILSFAFMVQSAEQKELFFSSCLPAFNTYFMRTINEQKEFLFTQKKASFISEKNYLEQALLSTAHDTEAIQLMLCLNKECFIHMIQTYVHLLKHVTDYFLANEIASIKNNILSSPCKRLLIQAFALTETLSARTLQKHTFLINDLFFNHTHLSFKNRTHYSHMLQSIRVAFNIMNKIEYFSVLSDAQRTHISFLGNNHISSRTYTISLENRLLISLEANPFSPLYRCQKSIEIYVNTLINQECMHHCIEKTETNEKIHFIFPIPRQTPFYAGCLTSSINN